MCVMLDGDYYVIDGIKCFIINVLCVGVFMLMVCMGGEGVGGILVFIVLVDMLGIMFGKFDKKMG